MESLEATVWQTPFTFASHPSVGLIIEADGEGTALLVVAPGGLDDYPKYLVRFSNVLSVTCGEEAGFSLQLGQDCSPREAAAHIWATSPYAASYAETVFGYGLEVCHYVIFGGDNIASVVAGTPPVIETVTEPREITVRYAV